MNALEVQAGEGDAASPALGA
eukprot:SAG11_NODE_33222_length_278_cov_1.150838_1_plen_20_part_01